MDSEVPHFGDVVEKRYVEEGLNPTDGVSLAAHVWRSETGRVELVYIGLDDQQERNQDDIETQRAQRVLRTRVLPRAVAEYSRQRGVMIQEVSPVIGHYALSWDGATSQDIVAVLRQTPRLSLGFWRDEDSLR